MSGERKPDIRGGQTDDWIVIDKDVFDEMYSLRNPSPDKHDYEGLEKHYKDKSYTYNELEKTINARYREKYYRYLDKLNRINQPEVIREDEWTSVKIGEKTLAGLEALFSGYRSFAREHRAEATCRDLDEYLKQWALRLIYNDMLSVRDFPDDLLTAFTIDEPETHLSYVSKAIEASETSGRPASLRVRVSTRNLLDRMRDTTFLETYDQTVIYLLNAIRSQGYRTYDETAEKAAGPQEDEAVLKLRKMRDVDDFIIDYIHMLKVKEIKNKR